MNAAPLRVACLGAGYFAQFHLDAWRRIDRALLVGVADQTLSQAQRTGAPAFTDLSQMLDQTRPQILDIVLPPASHAAAITGALAFGVETIICQKPFCRDLAEAEAMADLAEKAGTLLIVHENFRFQPWYRAIARAVSGGLIGTPLQATFRLRPGDGQGPAAYLDRQPYFRQMPRFLVHETGVHWIDTFRFLFGNPTAVYADLRRINAEIAGEDAGYVVFDHPGGMRALLDGNRHLDHATDNIRRTMGEALIEGTGGTLDLGGDGAVGLRRFGQSRVEPVLPADTHAGFGGDCVFHLQRHVVDAVLSGAVPENQADDYLNVIRTERAIYLSADSGRKIDLVTCDPG